jgi:hypothetical protein
MHLKKNEKNKNCYKQTKKLKKDSLKFMFIYLIIMLFYLNYTVLSTNHTLRITITVLYKNLFEPPLGSFSESFSFLPFCF